MAVNCGKGIQKSKYFVDICHVFFMEGSHCGQIKSWDICKEQKETLEV